MKRSLVLDYALICCPIGRFGQGYLRYRRHVGAVQPRLHRAGETAD